MQRRTFLKTMALSPLAFAAARCNPGKGDQSHILTFSFDDGFRNSFLQVADICESFGLKAGLNVIASGHFPSFQAVDDWILPELMGDFDDWNALVRRGHEVMPHSWQHLNLAKQPADKAKELIAKCLDYFEEHLEGYEATNAVFNFPFNASTPEIEAYTLSRVRAVRTFGNGALNPIPESGEKVRLQCLSMGPNNIDDWVEKQVKDFLASSGGWLILNVHGLDNEGWGPMSASYFKGLLERLVKVDYLEVLPAGEVLKRTSTA